MLRGLPRRIRTATKTLAPRTFSTFRVTAFNPSRPRLLTPHRPLSQSQRRLNSFNAKPSDALQKPAAQVAAEEDAKLPITQRLRILFKKYRWPALAVYLSLTTIDFCIAFIGVKSFGTEAVGRYEKIILKKVEEKTGWKTKGTPEHREAKQGETASIWTELALAYTIHKTLFALIRIPLTVAITPPLVRWYQRNGYGAVLAQLPAIGRFFQNSPAAVAARSQK